MPGGHLLPKIKQANVPSYKISIMSVSLLIWISNTNVCSYWYKSWEMCKKVCGEVDTYRDVQIPNPSKPDIPVSTT